MDIRPRPNILWRLFVVLGVGTMTALSVSDDAWQMWEDNVGDVVPRSAIRGVLAATLGLHALEAVVSVRRARAAGLDRPGRWGVSTFLWGFPVMVRLARARRAALTGTTELDAVVVVVDEPLAA
jgi:hypothetical protein